MDRWQHQLLLLHNSLKVPAENDPSLAAITKDVLEHIAVHPRMFSVQSGDENCSALFFLLLLSRSRSPCSRNSTESLPSVLLERIPSPNGILYDQSWYGDAPTSLDFDEIPLII